MTYKTKNRDILFLKEEQMAELELDWDKTIAVIETAVRCMTEGDYAQPVKPYLRYRNVKNRIIAMPAFVGGSINMAGIKWIASFPENIDKGIPRAHSVLILNNADTGEPLAIFCTALVSIIRTASVSGLVIRYFDRARELASINIGIIGFGPIGQYHLKMCLALLGPRINKVVIYDLRPLDTSLWDDDDRIHVAARWEDAYLDADIVITCTVSNECYIDREPKPGSLHLNVSLRDYKPDVHKWFGQSVIVDNWEEVCREHTDIEVMHIEKGLQKEDTKSIGDVVISHCLEQYAPDTPIMFNPMGMAVFDIAIGALYYTSFSY